MLFQFCSILLVIISMARFVGHVVQSFFSLCFRSHYVLLDKMYPYDFVPLCIVNKHIIQYNLFLKACLARLDQVKYQYRVQLPMWELCISYTRTTNAPPPLPQYQNVFTPKTN